MNKEEQRKKVLEIVKKVALKSLDHVKAQTHLEKVRNDQNKDFEDGVNAERKYVLDTINSEIKHFEALEPELFDGMFLLKKDLDEFDKEEQKENKEKKIEEEIKSLNKKYPTLELDKIMSQHTPQLRMMFLTGRLRELKYGDKN